ncbi:toxin glutamine deamidase domain-containing protein [Micromonospora sp. NPDC049836]|uniref:toxin glutamine deamidase domain-containing protein n=1 Tax=Micromonospora sp. NPDC049836 TaxID=3364274 RepID=UPI0037A4B3AE
MSLLPSPIPHPLDHCPWDLPGWIYEALDWVVGVEWPDGNERAVWDLADQWYAVSDVLGVPRADAMAAAGEVRSGYGGIGIVAEVFDTAWDKVAKGEDAPLHAVLAIGDEMGRIVESCGCDIEGAKLEVWIELGILVVELLSLAVATVLTLGAASPAAGAAVTASRMVVQQIFKRLVAQLARKAMKEGLKEAGERAAKEAARTGVRGFARRAAISGLVEAGQEAGTSLATQAYQNSTGRRDGLDLTDVGTSALGGFAGGGVAPLAGLGRHAPGGFSGVGERFGREMAGETLAEGAAGLATGQNASLEDLARAAVSGASGSATSQADTALQNHLDGKLTALTAPPMELSVPGAAQDRAGLVPAQPTFDPLAADAGSASPTQPEPVVAHSLVANPHPVAGEAGPPAGGAEHRSTPGHPDRAAVAAGPSDTHPLAGLDAPLPHTGAAANPTLSSVTVEPPLAAASATTIGALGGAGDLSSGPVRTTPGVDLGGSRQPVPVHTNPAPASANSPAPVTQPNAPTPVVPDRPPSGALPAQAGPLASPAPHQYLRPPADPLAAPPAVNPRPTPNPRFPLLEALAQQPAHDPAPPLPGPFDPLPPRRPTPEELAAHRAAEREGLDRRRYQAFLQSQRRWYEENRRQQRADWLRQRADYHEEQASDWAAQAAELHHTGRTLLAERYRREAYDSSRESEELRELARQVLAGTVVPAQVAVEDEADFSRINDDVADLAVGAVESSDLSALTGDGHPPPIDRSRRYGVRGGLRPPLALHQTDLERQMPRNPDGSVVRTADPRHGGWLQLANDGGPQADATRSINCLDCTLSLYETWVHGRPRVSAPRTFDGYLMGDVRQPVGGEADGPRRVEEITGGQFQDLCPGPEPTTDLEVRQRVEHGYRDLHRQLLAGGHGSYAFLITGWQSGASHAWVALNQNGVVLYLDPQQGVVWDQPLYAHSGVPHDNNVVGLDALVLGPDGRPMPVPGRPPGVYHVLPAPDERPEPPPPPDPPAPYDGDEPAPDFNRVHLLGEGTTFHHGDVPPPTGGPPEPGRDDATRSAHLAAHAERIGAGLFVRDAIAASAHLDEVFAAGVTPVELAHHVDPAALRRLVPALDEPAAGDLARLLGDPRVRHMLDQAWEAPPRGDPLLAETLLHQLARQPDLVRMILATPELATSLTARPITLHHLASHQKAIDVLGEVLEEIVERGAEIAATASIPPNLPTPLTAEQMAISSSLTADRPPALQPGFDQGRRRDVAYQRQFLDQLYEAAAVAQLEIDRLGQKLAAQASAEYRPRPGPKARKRAEDKIAKYGGDVSRLLDLAAGRLSYQRLADLYSGLVALQQDSQVRIVRFEDRFLDPQDGGYRDVQMMLSTSSGHVAEFRLQLAALDNVAEWEHSLFEVRRDLEAVAREQRRPPSQAELAISNGIIRRQRECFWAALRSTLDGGSD